MHAVDAKETCEEQIVVAVVKHRPPDYHLTLWRKGRMTKQTYVTVVLPPS